MRSRCCAAVLAFLLLCASAPLPGQAQGLSVSTLDELSRALRNVTNLYADRYVQPVTDALGADLNSGLYHGAKVGGGILPLLDVYVGVTVVGAPVSDGDRIFSLEGTETLPDGRTVTYSIQEAPTAFGTSTPQGSIEITDSDGNTVGTLTAPPGAIDASLAPLVIPQVRIGSVFGTDALIRYAPEYTLSGYGTVGFLGLGVRHNLDQHIPVPLPVKLAAQVSWQRLSVNDELAERDILTAQALAGSLIASRSLGPLSVYAGAQLERFALDVGYTFDPQRAGVEPVTVSFGQTGANAVRFVGGATFTLGFVQLHADYSIAAQPTISGGIGVQL